MKITFIDHSGFLVELENSVLLFDYYKGEIPEIGNKKWYVFASHFHEDHFNPEIFKLREKYENVTYILSKDIKKYRKRLLVEPYEIVTWNESYDIDGIFVETLQSTDEGCAFLVQAEDQVIFHAGDLNWWHWMGEPDEENEWMELAFTKQIDKISNRTIDVAFMLLDPRQEEAYDWGMNYFMEHTKAKKVIPMHMWSEYDWCRKYLQSDAGKKYHERFVEITKKGETISL
jgi:L-ascorbate metabolism protein UlaG (beta-lactamase superfamily)